MTGGRLLKSHLDKNNLFYRKLSENENLIVRKISAGLF